MNISNSSTGGNPNLGEMHHVSLEECYRIRNLNVPFEVRVSLFADICRINVLYMIACAGSGHIGSSFSSLDIVSRIFLEEQNLFGEKGDIYFSSKGHDVPGLYAVLIGLGIIEFQKLHQLRRLSGLPGHPDRNTSCMVANTGSLGMGISKAKGIVAADRLRGITRNIYVMLGDGELQEGQIWESLPSATNSDMGELIALVDHNKIQSDTWVTNVGHLGDIEAKFRAFGWHVQRIDGHDQQQIGNALSTAKRETTIPSVIVLDTVKGQGVSFLAGTAFGVDMEFYPYHSGALSDGERERAIEEIVSHINNTLREFAVPGLNLTEGRVPPSSGPPKNKGQNLVSFYSEALVNLGREQSNLVVLDGDLAVDCGLVNFRREFPKRFFECGIAEQDMVSQAGAMALQGFLPVVHSFSCFLSTRPNEQIYNNATENSRVIYTGALAGLVPGGPGHSHQAVRDISALGATPNLVMIEPSCGEEVVHALGWAVLENPNSTYLRLVSTPCHVPYEMPADYVFYEGRGVTLRDGVHVAVVTYGPVMLSEAFGAAEWLKKNRALDVKIIGLPWLNRLDLDWLESELIGIDRLYTMDNHFLKGGLGEKISVALADLGSSVKVKRLGLETIPVCGQNDEVLRFHGLDSESIARAICQD
jgi:transketolase